jgi:hypothetical protein
MKLIFMCFFCLPFFSLLQSQIYFTGTIKDSTSGLPLPDVYVLLKDSINDHILHYTISKDNGSFYIEIKNTNKTEYFLHTSRLGYEPFNKKIPVNTHFIEISLKESTTPLREVKIKSPPIRQVGDTINYYLSNFVQSQDKTLGDVLQRMPGIVVRDDGKILYEGQPIIRFYIEDMNLLEQRYSIATNNLSPDDIAVVQVYENHEPVKMLRDRSNSEQAAINIKLKDDVKAKWMKTYEFGIGGIPFLYDFSGTTARFARTNQSMIVAKANNTGKDILKELQMHTLKKGQVFNLGEIVDP